MFKMFGYAILKKIPGLEKMAMEYASFNLKWPKDGIFLSLYAHELSRYTFHWHETEYEINIILKGKAEYSCEGRLYLVETDDVIMINRNEGHGSFALAPGTVSVSFKFSADSLRNYVKSGEGFLFHCISDAASRYRSDFCKIRYFIFQIMDAAIRNNRYSEMTAKASTELLFSTLFHYFEPNVIPVISPRDESSNKAIRNIMKYIDRNYSSKIVLDDLARVSKYNRTYVSTFFKNNVGLNFHEYLTRVRFRHAIFELDNQDKNLTEIAIGNGFPDLKTFNYMFREIFHMNPAEYRARARDVAPREAQDKLRYCTQDDEILRKKLSEYLGLKDNPQTKSHLCSVSPDGII